LSHGDELEPMIPDFPNDEMEPEAPLPVSELTGIAAFPRGVKSGNCLHEIFESLDFTDETTIEPIVQDKLRTFSIHGHDEALCAAIRRTVRVPLEPDTPDFTLSGIPPSARLTELEFNFPIEELSASRLNAMFDHTWMLSFPTVSGFLKGYIDLAFEWEGKFYIVDWKSNWLGPAAESYSPSAMEAEMHRKRYDLQLHLYTIALHRYLMTRRPGYSYEEFFGGVFYIFVRGTDPANPHLGIHRARPDADRIEDLNALFSHALPLP
jgi:exodeoxyribonuclease V beta subunit